MEQSYKSEHNEVSKHYFCPFPFFWREKKRKKGEINAQFPTYQEFFSFLKKS